MQGLNTALGRSPGGGHDNPPQYSCLKNPMDREAWKTTVYRVTKNRTQLKWLNMHTCIECLFLRLIICKSASFFISYILQKYSSYSVLSFYCPNILIHYLHFFHIYLNALYSVSIVTNNLWPSIPKFDIERWLCLLSISFLIFFAKAFASFHMLEHTVFFLSLTDYVSQGTFAPPPELLSNTADLFRF